MGVLRKLGPGLHCVGSVRIWGFSGPYFPTYGLHTDMYYVNSVIKTPNADTFYAVLDTRLQVCLSMFDLFVTTRH